MKATRAQTDVLLAMAASLRSMILLQGCPGAGKSTVCKWFARSLGKRVALLVVAPTGTATQATAASSCGEGVVEERAFTLAEFLINTSMHAKLSDAFASGQFDKWILMFDEYAACTASDFERACELCATLKQRTKLQILMAGDHQQLPSVDTTIFKSRVFADYLRNAPTFLRLTEPVRCRGDPDMEAVFEAVRKRDMNKLCGMLAAKFYHRALPPREYTCLAFTNEAVDKLNSKRAAVCAAEGHTTYLLAGADGRIVQTLVKSARVLCTKNVKAKGTSGYVMVNGEIGTLQTIKGKLLSADRDANTKTYSMAKVEAHISLPGKPAVVVKAARDETGTTVLPIKPGWAITIHKAQGMTLSEGVYIDLTGVQSFASALVAITRGTTYEKLLVKPCDLQELAALAMAPLPEEITRFDALFQRALK